MHSFQRIGSNRSFTPQVESDACAWEESWKVPKPRGLINHVSIETAARERVCHRHKNGKDAKPIAAGERCLVIDTPVMGKQSYCLEAAVGIVAQARRDIDEIERQISDG